jgi:hypothetical protein
MTKPKGTLDLLPLISDETKFRQAMILLPVWEEVVPKPYPHSATDIYGKCAKCHKMLRKNGTYGEYVPDAFKINCSIPDAFTGSLAELAFGLRDKAVVESIKDYYFEACNVVTLKAWGYFSLLKWNEKATSKHWICAALLALELTKEGKGK